MSDDTSLFPALREPSAKEAVAFGDDTVTYAELLALASPVVAAVSPFERVAVWAEPCVETCAAVVGALAAGAAVVPLNPRLGTRELEHILQDSAPGAVLHASSAELPPGLSNVPSLPVSREAAPHELPPEPDPESPAFILYTSGTTGPPKGAILPRRALTSNLDALAQVWEWTPDDVLVHGLPLFHAHGLVLGTIGPLRLGGTLRHLERFTPEGLAKELRRGGTMVFGVPTMYHRLADAAETDTKIRASLADARVLISGSAPLPVREHDRIHRATGQRVVERYGLTETLMNCSVRVDGERRPGYVGLPLPGVQVELIDDEGITLEVTDDETIGEIRVRGPNLFHGYLNRPEATTKALRDGWFYTGDLATRSADGYIRIVGRRETDLIKTGGYKVGAGEVEAALLEHPAVAEAAVLGLPDHDLGERIVSWVVLRAGRSVSETDLIDHVATLISPHKRPRAITFAAELPRNEMGKIRKSVLREQGSLDVGHAVRP